MVKIWYKCKSGRAKGWQSEAKDRCRDETRKRQYGVNKKGCCRNRSETEMLAEAKKIRCPTTVLQRNKNANRACSPRCGASRRGSTVTGRHHSSSSASSSLEMFKRFFLSAVRRWWSSAGWRNTEVSYGTGNLPLLEQIMPVK